jgi:hypothetical protein
MITDEEGILIAALITHLDLLVQKENRAHAAGINPVVWQYAFQYMADKMGEKANEMATN